MKIKNILISQPEPANLENTPYYKLIEKYDLKLTFYKFFEVVGISAAEFRKTKVHINEHTAVIFNSKQAVDHFFRMAKELRETPANEMKYFCTTESIALYLQNYIQYRKRKVFFAEQTFADLIDLISKHKEERFIFPCSSEKQTEYTKLLDKGKYKYTKATMYKSVPRDLSKFDMSKFDMIVLFSPIGVRSLLESYPDFKENSKTIVAAFGTSTHAALNAAEIKISVAAPTKNAPSMATAIENFVIGKDLGAVVVSKPSSLKKNPLKKGDSKKAKSVFTNKSKYKQLLEEKKAQAAARRKERQEEKARKEAEMLAQNKAETPAPRTRTRATKKTDTKNDTPEK